MLHTSHDTKLPNISSSMPTIHDLDHIDDMLHVTHTASDCPTMHPMSIISSCAPNTSHDPSSAAAASCSTTSATAVPPGFRFHPTDEELVDYYLRKKVNMETFELDVIRDVDLNKLEPWDLHERCRIDSSQSAEWYFFSHKDKKYPTGTRTNRATMAGFWKATGRDKAVHSRSERIGMRKTLVFYRGRAPHGQKTDWIMHEYRLEDHASMQDHNNEDDGWAVCRVFKKRFQHHHLHGHHQHVNEAAASNNHGNASNASEPGGAAASCMISDPRRRVLKRQRQAGAAADHSLRQPAAGSRRYHDDAIPGAAQQQHSSLDNAAGLELCNQNEDHAAGTPTLLYDCKEEMVTHLDRFNNAYSSEEEEDSHSSEHGDESVDAHCMKLRPREHDRHHEYRRRRQLVQNDPLPQSNYVHHHQHYQQIAPAATSFLPLPPLESPTRASATCNIEAANILRNSLRDDDHVWPATSSYTDNMHMYIEPTTASITDDSCKVPNDASCDGQAIIISDEPNGLAANIDVINQQNPTPKTNNNTTSTRNAANLQHVTSNPSAPLFPYGVSHDDESFNTSIHVTSLYNHIDQNHQGGDFDQYDYNYLINPLVEQWAYTHALDQGCNDDHYDVVNNIDISSSDPSASLRNIDPSTTRPDSSINTSSSSVDVSSPSRSKKRSSPPNNISNSPTRNNVSTSTPLDKMISSPRTTNNVSANHYCGQSQPLAKALESPSSSCDADIWSTFNSLLK